MVLYHFEEIIWILRKIETLAKGEMLKKSTWGTHWSCSAAAKLRELSNVLQVGIQSRYLQQYLPTSTRVSLNLNHSELKPLEIPVLVEHEIGKEICRNARGTALSPLRATCVQKYWSFLKFHVKNAHTFLSMGWILNLVTTQCLIWKILLHCLNLMQSTLCLGFSAPQIWNMPCSTWHPKFAKGRKKSGQSKEVHYHYLEAELPIFENFLRASSLIFKSTSPLQHLVVVANPFFVCAELKIPQQSHVLSEKCKAIMSAMSIFSTWLVEIPASKLWMTELR